jgi:hypothetical protein
MAWIALLPVRLLGWAAKVLFETVLRTLAVLAVIVGLLALAYWAGGVDSSLFGGLP